MDLALSMLAKGANPNAVDDHHTTALMMASARGEFETVRTLLNRGANPNLKDDEGATALLCAVSPPDVVLGLLRGNTTRYPRADIVQMLLDRGADPNARNRGGLTVLMISTSFEEDKQVRDALLTHNADVNAKDNNGCPVLVFAPPGAEELLSSRGATFVPADVKACLDLMSRSSASSGRLGESYYSTRSTRPAPADHLLVESSSSPIEPWYADLHHGGITRVNIKDGLTYVWIPPGSFTMGCSPGDSGCNSSEKPAHEVTLTKGFWIGQTEVTQAAYQRLMGGNPSHFKGVSLPVEQIRWNDAQSYCQAAGMRLPTEAEWEYAARGGNTSARYGAANAVAWYEANSENSTHGVGQKQANGYGLYDTLGNVWEWVADWYGEYSGGNQQDPHGPTSGRLRTRRGGSSGLLPWNVRVSYRSGSVPEDRDGSFGVRCAGD